MSKTQEVYRPLYTDKEHFIILITGGRGCERPDQRILMADKTIREIRHIGKGDLVMGDDMTPRRVLGTTHGYGMMYRVKSLYDYEVNDSHILTLSDGRKTYDIHILLYLQLPYHIRKGLRGVVIQRGERKLCDIEIEPIGHGEWCGLFLDGNQRYLHDDGTVTHNSGKSFNVSRFISRLTFEYSPAKKIAHQILYTRYTMVSAGMSIIPEFLEKIELDGTQKYFHKSGTDIVNQMTKARVMFRGIQTSSGNQTAKLKSVQGVTTFICDEAEEWVNEEDFDKIMLSIRTQGLQNRIIIIMNPCTSAHWVYQRFIRDTHRVEYIDGVPVEISTHPNVLHIHTTYLDNIENLDEQFLKNVLEMKVKDPDKYAHIVIGAWASLAEGAIFKKWGIVKEFPEDCDKVGIGLDWGYVNDPTAAVLCGVKRNMLYMKLLIYERGLLSGQIAKRLLPYTRKGISVYADCADERLIQEVRNYGVIIYGAQKGPGSIVAGIDKILSFEQFITEDSIELRNEWQNYTWLKDKMSGQYINQPDPNCADHGCDAVRYYITGRILGKIIVPKILRKSDYNIP